MAASVSSRRGSRSITPATPRPDYGLPRETRLRSGLEHAIVRSAGRHQHGHSLRMGVSETPSHVTRSAVVVSRRVGSAVVRNRVKRRLREIYRLHRALLKTGLLLVVTAKPCAAKTTTPSLLAEWLRLGRRLSIFTDS